MVALAVLSVHTEVLAGTTALEDRLLSCVSECSETQERYTAVVLLGNVRASPDAISRLDAAKDGTSDPLFRVLAAYVLYRLESHRKERGEEYVEAIAAEGVGGQLWPLAIRNTRYFNIIDFWEHLADIAVNFDNPKAMDVLFRLAGESGANELPSSAIIAAVVRDPVKAVAIMDRIEADEAVLKVAMELSLNKRDGLRIQRALEKSDSGSSYRRLLLEHIAGR